MDPTTSPPASIAAAPPRRRRWLLYAFALLGLLVAVPLAFFAYMGWSTRNSWADAEAEADRIDPGWRLHELLEKRTPIADKDNAALHIIATAAKAKNFSVADGADYKRTFAKLPPTARLNEQQLKLIRGKLGTIPRPLEEARLLKDMPQGRFPLTFSDDYISTLIPDHQSARNLGDWLVHDAYLLAHEQKFDEAVQSCRASLNAGRVMKDDLFVIAHLIRVAIQAKTIAALERVLAQGEASEDLLKVMQEQFAKEIGDSCWLTSMRGERAGGHLLFDNIRAGKVKTTMLRGLATGKPVESVSDWLADNFPSTLLNYYPEHLQLMTECVEIAKLPIHEQRPLIDAWDKKQKVSRNPIVSLLAPGLVKVYDTDCRSQANLRTALVALACERYRLRHKDNAWPMSLDDLVKAKLLDALPLDPIDGQPLRYFRNQDSIVIYSIGTDGIDNGGHIDRDQADPKGLDVGFRLWNRERRAGPPRPPVE